jgi:hypothetical protein
MRWLHECNWPNSSRAEGRSQQSQFAHAGLLHQQVDKCDDGPATAGQFNR